MTYRLLQTKVEVSSAMSAIYIGMCERSAASRSLSFRSMSKSTVPGITTGDLTQGSALLSCTSHLYIASVENLTRNLFKCWICRPLLGLLFSAPFPTIKFKFLGVKIDL